MVSTICAVLGVLFMSAVESHYMYGIMAITMLGLCAQFSCMAYDEKLKHIQSNADEDRPE